MAAGVIRSLHNEEVDRCVDIIVQPDGTFIFKEFRRDPEDAGRWTLVNYNPRATYATEEQAITAAEAAVAWLREQGARKRDDPGDRHQSGGRRAGHSLPAGGEEERLHWPHVRRHVAGP